MLGNSCFYFLGQRLGSMKIADVFLNQRSQTNIIIKMKTIVLKYSIFTVLCLLHAIEKPSKLARCLNKMAL
jgi:hypothetical protein